MNRQDFTDNSIEQLIFDYWDGAIKSEETFRKMLGSHTKQELTDIIVDAQARGRFGDGFYHP